MDAIGYSLKMNFADFFGAEVEKREVNGIMEDCLVIPMRLNGMYLSKKKGNKAYSSTPRLCPQKQVFGGKVTTSYKVQRKRYRKS